MYCTDPKFKTISGLRRAIKKEIVQVKLICSSLFPHVKEPLNGTLKVQMTNGDEVAVEIYNGQIKRAFR